jgi:hypothetical protein
MGNVSANVQFHISKVQESIRVVLEFNANPVYPNA